MNEVDVSDLPKSEDFSPYAFKADEDGSEPQMAINISANYGWCLAFADHHKCDLARALGEKSFVLFSLTSEIYQALRPLAKRTPGFWPLFVSFNRDEQDGLNIIPDYEIGFGSPAALSTWDIGEPLGIRMVALDSMNYYIGASQAEKFINWVRETVKVVVYSGDPFEDITWTPETLVLRRDAEFFISHADWFSRRKLPYARSYLLHGDPGNGKTTFIRALARKLSLKPDTFDFSAAAQAPDSAFLSWIGAGQASNELEHAEEDDKPRKVRRLIVLEDLDRFFQKSELSTRVSFSALLNGLDGVGGRQDSILVATANHPELLFDKQALLRPGRFDLHVQFPVPDIESGKNLLRHLLRFDAVTEDGLQAVAEACKGHSFAFLKGLVSGAASIATTRRSEQIDDTDLLAAANEHLDGALTDQIRAAKKHQMGFTD